MRTMILISFFFLVLSVPAFAQKVYVGVNNSGQASMLDEFEKEELRSVGVKFVKAHSKDGLINEDSETGAMQSLQIGIRFKETPVGSGQKSGVSDNPYVNMGISILQSFGFNNRAAYGIQAVENSLPRTYSNVVSQEGVLLIWWTEKNGNGWKTLTDQNGASLVRKVTFKFNVVTEQVSQFDARGNSSYATRKYALISEKGKTYKVPVIKLYQMELEKLLAPQKQVEPTKNGERK